MDREHIAKAWGARVQLHIMCRSFQLGNIDVETQFDARRKAVAVFHKLEAGKTIIPPM